VARHKKKRPQRGVFVSTQFGTPAGQEPVYRATKEAIDPVNAKHGL
jgi:hypothetical protein